ncbi:hypothetical protein DV36_35290 [Amycolatopsis mediterranei]|nr:hypothetical protein DV36_35290 [Amycolatopsis mediterranei]
MGEFKGRWTEEPVWSRDHAAEPELVRADRSRERLDHVDAKLHVMVIAWRWFRDEFAVYRGRSGYWPGWGSSEDFGGKVGGRRGRG